jgi:hypothetical protein
MKALHFTAWLRRTVALLAVVSLHAGAAAPLPHYSKDKTVGVASCASSLCHGAIETWKDSNVLQNEYIIWSRVDKHARAYAVLLNERSKEIARKLGLKEPAHRADVCLDCHAHNVPAARRGEGFVLADGVTCEACHGPAERWLKRHVEPTASHADNIAHGLFPTSDDVSRAKLCLSCHFGNAQKFVTHRIMAAGHPRMSFELDTFTQIAPAHFKVDADWQKRKRLWDGVRIWAVGQALAAQELLAILGHPQRGRDGMFPELVLFDCHSCHHPMTDKRNTAARVNAGPGIVRLNDASLLMLRQIARRVDAGGADGFAQQVDRLHKSVTGGSDGLAQAKATHDLIERMIPRITAYRFAAADLRGMMEGLIADGLSGQYGDYQGAEQAVMALQSIGDFMTRHGHARPAQLQPRLKRLLAVVGNDEKYKQAELQAALRDLAGALQAVK